MNPSQTDNPKIIVHEEEGYFAFPSPSLTKKVSAPRSYEDSSCSQFLNSSSSHISYLTKTISDPFKKGQDIAPENLKVLDYLNDNSEPGRRASCPSNRLENYVDGQNPNKFAQGRVNLDPKYYNLQEEPELEDEESPDKNGYQTSSRMTQHTCEDLTEEKKENKENKIQNIQTPCNKKKEDKTESSAIPMAENSDTNAVIHVQEIEPPNSVPLQSTVVSVAPLNSQEENMRNLYRPEVKIYLTRVLYLIFSIGLFSLFFLLNISFKFPWEFMLILVMIYCFANVSIELFWKYRVLEEAWLESDEKFQILDLLAGAISLVWIGLKFWNISPICIVSFLTLLQAALFYLCLSTRPLRVKLANFFMKTSVSMQVLLITLKIDNFISFRWEWVLIIAFIHLGVRSVYCIKYGLSFIWKALSILSRRNTEQNQSNGVELTGCFWCFIYYGFNIIGIVVAFGFSQAYNPTNDFELLLTSIYIVIAVSVFFIIYTLIKWKQLTEWIINNKFIISLMVIYHRNIVPKHKRTVSIHPEKKNSYFVMLSSTYYLPLQESFYTQGKKSLDKIKKMLNKRNARNPENRASKVVDIQALKQDKENFDLKFSKMQDGAQNAQKVRKNKPPKILSLSDLREHAEDNTAAIGKLNLPSVCNRMTEMIIESDSNSPSKRHEDELLCYLCYCNPPNAILVSCGHGGICYECAVALVNKKNECMECRKEVEAIYKIDPNPKMKNIIKGVELNKVITTIV